MTLTSPPWALQQGSHGAQLVRTAHGSLLSQTGGIVQPDDLAVTQNATPNMSVNVGAGRVWVPSTYSGTINPGGGAFYPDGLYYAENDATVNLAISAANPSNPRVDLVIVQVQDAAYSGSTNSAQLAIVVGTPTAGASLSNPVGAGTVPASSLLLGGVLVPAGATSIVTVDIQNVAPLVSIALSGNWTALTLGSGVIANTSGSGYTPSAMLAGRRVWLKGVIQNNSGSAIATGSTIFTIPSSTMYPSANAQFVALAAGGGATSGLMFSVQTSGATVLSSAGPSWGSSTSLIALDGLSYSLS